MVPMSFGSSRILWSFKSLTAKFNLRRKWEESYIVVKWTNKMFPFDGFFLVQKGNEYLISFLITLGMHDSQNHDPTHRIVWFCDLKGAGHSCAGENSEFGGNCGITVQTRENVDTSEFFKPGEICKLNGFPCWDGENWFLS